MCHRIFFTVKVIPSKIIQSTKYYVLMYDTKFFYQSFLFTVSEIMIRFKFNLLQVLKG